MSAPLNSSTTSVPPPPVPVPQSNKSSKFPPRPNRRNKNFPPPTVESFKKSEFQRNRDALIRMNFLYQSAHFYSQFRPPPDNSQIGGHRPLARFFASTMKKIASRLVVRLDSSIKNSICKNCGSVLVSGPTAGKSLENFGGSCEIKIDENSTLKKLCLACSTETIVNIRKEIREKNVREFTKERRKKRKKLRKIEKKLEIQTQENSKEIKENFNEIQENSIKIKENLDSQEIKENSIRNVENEKCN